MAPWNCWPWAREPNLPRCKPSFARSAAARVDNVEERQPAFLRLGLPTARPFALKVLGRGAGEHENDFQPADCSVKGKDPRDSDFPKPGILFYDITHCSKTKLGFAMLVDQLSEHYIGRTSTWC